MHLYLNNKVVCESKAFYTTKAGDGNWTTIGKMGECQELINVVKGDKLRADALYDTVAHPL
jgi:hypothetical protein